MYDILLIFFIELSNVTYISFCMTYRRYIAFWQFGCIDVGYMTGLFGISHVSPSLSHPYLPPPLHHPLQLALPHSLHLPFHLSLSFANSTPSQLDNQNLAIDRVPTLDQCNRFVTKARPLPQWPLQSEVHMPSTLQNLSEKPIHENTKCCKNKQLCQCPL